MVCFMRACRNLHGLLSLHFSLTNYTYREFLGVGEEAAEEPEDDNGMIEEQKAVMTKVFADDKNIAKVTTTASSGELSPKV